MFVYNGSEYPTRAVAYAARREHYFELLFTGNNSTQAAYMVGVSKRLPSIYMTLDASSVKLVIAKNEALVPGSAGLFMRQAV